MNKKNIFILSLVIIIPILSAFGYFALRGNNKEGFIKSGREGPIKNCKDSDRGADYFTKGYIEFLSTVYDNDGSKKENVIQKKEDECLIKIKPEDPKSHSYICEWDDCYRKNVSQCYGNNCYIGEQVCVTGTPKFYQCPNGCKDGACIK